jgi:hypothetical protein
MGNPSLRLAAALLVLEYDTNVALSTLLPDGRRVRVWTSGVRVSNCLRIRVLDFWA